MAALQPPPDGRSSVQAPLHLANLAKATDLNPALIYQPKSPLQALTAWGTILMVDNLTLLTRANAREILAAFKLDRLGRFQPLVDWLASFPARRPG